MISLYDMIISQVVISALVWIDVVVSKKWHGTGGKAFNFMIVIQIIWLMVSSTSEMTQNHVSVEVLFLLEQNLLSFIAIAWGIVGIEYSGLKHWLTSRKLVWFLLIPAVTVLFSLTNDLHGLMILPSGNNIFLSNRLVGWEFGPWFIVHVLYSNMMIMSATGMMYYHFLNDLKENKRKRVSAYVAMLLTVGLNLAAGIYYKKTPNIGIPMAYSISIIILYYFILRINMLDVVTEAGTKVLDSLQDLIVVTGKKGVIINANRAVHEIGRKYGIPIIGQTFEEAIVPLNYSIEVMEQANGQKYEKYYLRWQDDVQCFILHETTMVNVLGRQIGKMKFHKDITTLDKVSSELQVALEIAEKANESKNHFLSKISHEMRTPLNAIMGMTELLLETHMSEVHQKDADTIIEAAEILKNVIDDVLDTNKIALDQISLHPERIVLADCIASVVEMLSIKFKKKSVAIQTHIDPGIPLVWGDADKIKQILVNLINNALKYTKEGLVAIRLEVISQTPYELEALFTVTDTGIGIDESRLETIFEPFEHEQTGSEEKGTGLGLFIVKKLTQAMKGSLGVKSEVYRGSEFWVKIPLKVAYYENKITEKNSIHHQQNQGNPIVKTGKVLLVEDNAINQKIAMTQLQGLGYEVEVAENGLTALQMYQNDPNGFSLILMDCQMPIMDGYMTTQNIRQYEADLNQHIPIIAMTADVFTQDIERCLACGMDAHLGKPVRKATLKSTLEKWMVD